mgnify:CR=1 FL=1
MMTPPEEMYLQDIFSSSTLANSVFIFNCPFSNTFDDIGIGMGAPPFARVNFYLHCSKDGNLSEFLQPADAAAMESQRVV